VEFVTSFSGLEVTFPPNGFGACGEGFLMHQNPGNAMPSSLALTAVVLGKSVVKIAGGPHIRLPGRRTP